MPLKEEEIGSRMMDQSLQADLFDSFQVLTDIVSANPTHSTLIMVTMVESPGRDHSHN
jgi:hypothetical protein